MTDPITLAFAHPSARAEATASDDPLDRISVRDMVLEADIGAFQAERGAPQRLRFNVVVEVQPQDALVDDDVDRILSYDRVTEAIELELAAERLNLLETLAERVADRILLAPQAERVFVRVEKLDRGPGNLGVEIVRNRAAGHAVEEDTPQPVVVYLSNAAMASDNLASWIDQLADRAAILCVGPSETASPEGGHPMVQRRIDLLALEQNAWVLAGRDPRCVVVGTRTELDWGLRNGQLSVWAPSKMILDATHPPEAGPDAPVALAQWFAGEMHATQILCIGATPPSGDAPGAPCPTAMIGVEAPTLPL